VVIKVAMNKLEWAALAIGVAAWALFMWYVIAYDGHPPPKQSCAALAADPSTSELTKQDISRQCSPRVPSSNGIGVGNILNCHC